MQITDIRIRLLKDDGRMRAVVSITFDGEFVVHDIKVIEGPDKLFLAMPSRRLPDCTFADIVHPINADVRARIEREVLARYHETVNSGGIPAGFHPLSPGTSRHMETLGI